MNRFLHRRQILLLLSLAAMRPALAAGDFPDHPLTLVVPFPPAGGTDALARLLARRLEPILHQPVVVQNVAGALGTIGSAQVARATPDGYTMLLGISGTHAIAPSLYPHLPYDPLKDFVPVAQLATIGNVLVVNPEVPVHNVKELVAWAAKQPNGVSYGSWGVGSGGHLAMEMIKSKTGMQAVHVPYKGAMLALSDAVAGQIPVAMTDTTSAMTFYRSGKVRMIAVTGSRRVASMPDVPTLAEQGIAFDTDSWYALFVPAKTPPAALQVLRSSVAEVMAQPEVVKTLGEFGMNPSTLSPTEFQVAMKKDIATWAGLVKLSGATAE